MKSLFSLNWLRSTQPRKQRKFRFNAPAHIKGEFMNVHLAKELKTKYSLRSLRVRKGDKVKILRGTFKGQSGTVERVVPVREQVFVSGIAIIKKDGGKVPYPLHPSNLLLTTIITDDKRRLKKIKSSEK